MTRRMLTLALSLTLICSLAAYGATRRQIPLGHAGPGAEAMANETGTVRLELVNAKGDQTENE